MCVDSWYGNNGEMCRAKGSTAKRRDARREKSPVETG
jgi:hypothetical protein